MDIFSVWSLIDYEKILFVSPDTIFVQNIDHLLNEDKFTAPHDPTSCTCPRGNTQFLSAFGSSSFFVLQPSLSKLEEIIEASKETKFVGDIIRKVFTPKSNCIYFLLFYI